MKKMFVLGAAALLVAGVRPADAQRRDIRCESRDGRQSWCRVNTSGGVRLVRQLSDARCTRGRTWDADRSGIWVSRGCRADFEVGYSGYGSNDGYRRNGDWNNGRVSGSASNLCRAAVARRIGTQASRVNTWNQRQRGNSVELGWRAGRSDGSCIVNRNGRVSVQVDHRNSDWDRRDRDRDRDRDRGRDRDRDRDRHGYHN